LTMFSLFVPPRKDASGCCASMCGLPSLCPPARLYCASPFHTRADVYTGLVFHLHLSSIHPSLSLSHPFLSLSFSIVALLFFFLFISLSFSRSLSLSLSLSPSVCYVSQPAAGELSHSLTRSLARS